MPTYLFLLIKIIRTLIPPLSSNHTRPPLLIAALGPLPAQQLTYLGPETDGRTQESRFVGVDDGFFPDEVGLVTH